MFCSYTVSYCVSTSLEGTLRALAAGASPVGPAATRGSPRREPPGLPPPLHGRRNLRPAHVVRQRYGFRWRGRVRQHQRPRVQRVRPYPNTFLCCLHLCSLALRGPPPTVAGIKPLRKTNACGASRCAMPAHRRCCASTTGGRAGCSALVGPASGSAPCATCWPSVRLGGGRLLRRRRSRRLLRRPERIIGRGGWRNPPKAS